MNKSKKIIAIFSLLILICIQFTSCFESEKAKNVIDATTSTIELENCSFNITGFSTADQVAPEKPDGYYKYYEKFDGYEYDVLKGTAVNNGQVDFDPKSIELKMKIKSGYKDAIVIFQNEEKSNLEDTLKAGATRDFFIICLRSKKETVASELSIFYNNQFAKGDGKNWDNRLNYKISK